MRRAAMSKRADALVIRVAQPEERETLEELQGRASLALPEYRAQLEAHPDAIHLPPAQVANGQVLVAELDGRIALCQQSEAAVRDLDFALKQPAALGQ